MTALQLQTRPVDGRRNLIEVLQFLADRGVSADVVRLAMVRAGIPADLALALSQCVVSSQPLLPSPAPRRASPDTGRAASLALRGLVRVSVVVFLYLGLGLALGFSLGMEMGLAQGLEHGIDQVLRLVVR
jgi:hypothetical protein